MQEIPYKHHYNPNMSFGDADQEEESQYLLMENQAVNTVSLIKTI